MGTYENREFVQWYDSDSAAEYGPAHFVKCRFESCGLSITQDPRLRAIVRDVTLTKCEVRGCTLDAAILENVLVDGLKTHGLLQAWAPVLKHVTLRGKIGRMMIGGAVATGTATPAVQRAFDLANAEYYSTVDWALDITEAELEECELQRVPAHLVRRDPATQFVIKREKAMQGHWRNLDLSKTHWKTSIEFMLNRGDADVVLVAGKRDRKFRDLLDGLKKLRDAGVAEPD